MGRGLGGSWNLGTAAEWFAGVLAGSALVIGARQWEHDSAQRIRAQADNVAVWLGKTSNAPSGCPTEVHVRNASKSPIFNVVAWDGTERRGDDGWECSDLPGLQHLACWHVVPPDTDEVAELTLMAAVLETPWMAVLFTDAGGRHWLRAAERLDKIDKHPFDWLKIRHEVEA